MSILKKVLNTVGNVISLPIEVISDVSCAVRGKPIGAIKNRVKEIGRDIVGEKSDLFDEEKDNTEF
jgi:hypothetical protein